MQDNYTDKNIEMLIRYMDNELSIAEKREAETMLEKDAGLKEHYELLLAARQGIQSLGLKQRVQAIQQEYLSETEKQQSKSAKVVPLKKIYTAFLKIAAVFLVAVAGVGIFQFSTTSNNSVYDDNYVEYRLPVNRGNETVTNTDAFYSNKNYKAVIETLNNTKQKSQKDYFLLAQAYLHLNKADSAIDEFNALINLNNQTPTKYFVEETDYYLALAFIKAGRIDDAEKQMNKITANKHHLFYNKAKQVSKTKLAILKWKEK